ncbi:MAG: bifunctional aspartate kinase/diaminopimelate decarboxylase [Gammaproteobacteria bacterium]|nr:bifunctional aspartate kinase/diaminopimelate decarboxylase [Gammaproteobacteria bacterium]
MSSNALHAAPNFVVLKFGGTSVSTATMWAFIARVVTERLKQGKKPVVVHSALSGVSNRLEAIALGKAAQIAPIIAAIQLQHSALAADLGLVAAEVLAAEFEELQQLATGIALLGEASPKTHARLMALGELMSTRLGAAYLNAQGIPTQWLDARELLVSERPAHAGEASLYLSAVCPYEAEPGLQQRLAALDGVLLSQGFIAANERGETVLLGRGGSDTSGAYFGAKLEAERVEIWTDVPGMFTANPRAIPEARLLKQLDYDEAQEIASTGAKVLHPRCLAPVRAGRIPLWVLCTDRPELPGTIVAAAQAGAPQVKAISVKKGITLVSLETLGMWQQVGFLADAFGCFKRLGLSIDLVSTSETNITVTLDPGANALSEAVLAELHESLSELAKVSILRGCAAVSLVGRQIRAVLPELGPALELLAEHQLHLVTQAASDLNLSLVLDEDHADALAAELHKLLIRRADSVLGPTWAEFAAQRPEAGTAEPAWWETRREALLALAGEGTPAYVYDAATLAARAAACRALPVDRVFYALKANSHPDVLRAFEAAGLGFECVSPGEIDHVLGLFPGLDRERILFTPNFAPRGEYAHGLALGLTLTLDNLHPLRAWPELFAGRELLVRVDLGRSKGHHAHVRTEGQTSKFGVPLSELAELRELAERAGARIIGLHNHAGSGILDASTWRETALSLAQLAEDFPELRILDLGGGLGVPDRRGRAGLDLAAVAEGLTAFRAAYPRFALWLEPGRYLVAESGVLLARVTQLKGKGEARYIGVDAGMNSLIRPALYGAHHEIVNLSRLDQACLGTATVVGPICETGDVLGVDLPLPDTAEGDVLLIATAGAYGAAMASRYNLREPARERLLV